MACGVIRLELFDAILVTNPGLILPKPASSAGKYILYCHQKILLFLCYNLIINWRINWRD
jgi:hypothetical protein